MAGINKVILVGNLGADPVVRYTPSGSAVANISLATSETWKDKEGQKQEQTEWHKVVFFNRLGEIAGEYLKKGSKVYVEGKLKTRKWQNKEGQDQYTTEIVADTMQMLDSKGAGGSYDNENSHYNSTKKSFGTDKNEVDKNKNEAPVHETFDDDIPF